MKLFVGLAALALAMSGTAHAANISGTYSLHYITLCQSIENEVISPSTKISTIDQGRIGQTVGSITFSPSSPAGLSGTVTASLSKTTGSLAILGLPGPPATPAVPDMQIQSVTQTGTYSLIPVTPPAPSTLKITFDGQSLDIFRAYLTKVTGSAAGSVYGHIEFVGLDGPIGGKRHCSNLGAADLQ